LFWRTFFEVVPTSFEDAIAFDNFGMVSLCNRDAWCKENRFLVCCQPLE
jgi:hypothetical protein